MPLEPGDCLGSFEVHSASDPRALTMAGVRGRVRSYLRSLLGKKPSSGEVLVALDGLRGFAVLIVIASHAQAFGMWGQGGLGVWVFYVLSGFLLTRILLLKLPQSLGPVDLLRYVIRRIARILPLYYLVLASVAVLKDHDGRWLFAHATFQQADGHFWSIPQEELFYLLLPLLIGLVSVTARLTRLPHWAIGVALATAIQLTHPLGSLNGNGSRQPFCLDVFSIGLALALAWPTPLAQRFRAPEALAGLSNLGSLLLLAATVATAPVNLKLLGILGGVVAPDASLWFPAWAHPTLAALLSAALLALALKPGSWANRVFSWTPLRVLGVLSFSLYLVHPFVLEGLAALGAPSAGLALFVMTSLTSMALGLVLERTVERPFMALGRRINARL